VVSLNYRLENYKKFTDYKLLKFYKRDVKKIDTCHPEQYVEYITKLEEELIARGYSVGDKVSA